MPYLICVAYLPLRRHAIKQEFVLFEMNASIFQQPFAPYLQLWNLQSYTLSEGIMLNFVIVNQKHHNQELHIFFLIPQHQNSFGQS